jgi:sulfite reductase (ferredoxin)
MKTYEIPSDIQNEIDGLKDNISLFRQEEINPVKFKGIRVAQGIYEQRKDDTYMFRIRCAGGVVTPTQLKRVAELSEEYGTDHFHVTTRQDLQFHYIALEDTPAAYEGLIESGLSPRGGGGNTIRNIMASIDSGYSKTEEFDVLPYAQALTTRMISEDDSWNLPRKFKTAFSNSYSDSCEASITCLGFVAKHQDGKKGFAVWVGGGMGAKPMPGQMVWDFIDADDVYSLTKAIKIMFDKNGNRRSRFVAKIKFLVKKLGVEEFRRLVEEEWAIVKASNPPVLDIAAYTYEYKAAENISVQPVEVSGEVFETWKRRYVSSQKQEGLFSIKVPLKLGDIENQEGIALADLISPFGENTIRLAFNQNLHIINIPEAYLGYIFNGLSSFHTLSTLPVIISNMIACTGAATCRLGLCLPRGVLPETAQLLLDSDLNLDELDDFKIHVSGCPNTCGRHHSGDIGLFGRVGRKDKVSFPAYNFLAGAVIQDGEATFAKKVTDVAAKHAPEMLFKVVELWLAKKSEFETFRAFVDGEGAELIKAIALSFKETVPTLEENNEFYVDWGATKQFSVLHGQTAECSAGVFDMIDVDAKDIKESLAAYADVLEVDQPEALYHLSFIASRMLLVTRNIDVKTDEQAFRMFDTHFIEAHLVSDEFRPVVEIAKDGEKSDLVALEEKVLKLGSVMLELYASMDDSLRFPKLNKTA